MLNIIIYFIDNITINKELKQNGFAVDCKSTEWSQQVRFLSVSRILLFLF